MIKINLLEKKSFIEEVRSHLNIFALELFVVGLVCILLLITMYTVTKKLSYQSIVLQREIDVLNGIFMPVQKRKADIDKTEKIINNYIEKINRVLSLKQRQEMYHLLLINLENNLPDDCWINELVYNGRNNTVEIAVNALRSDSITLFINNLNMNSFFTNIKLEKVRTSKEKGFNVNEFKVIFSINEASI